MPNPAPDLASRLPVGWRLSVHRSTFLLVTCRGYPQPLRLVELIAGKPYQVINRHDGTGWKPHLAPDALQWLREFDALSHDEKHAVWCRLDDDQKSAERFGCSGQWPEHYVRVGQHDQRR